MKSTIKLSELAIGDKFSTEEYPGHVLIKTDSRINASIPKILCVVVAYKTVEAKPKLGNIIKIKEDIDITPLLFDNPVSLYTPKEYRPDWRTDVTENFLG